MGFGGLKNRCRSEILVRHLMRQNNLKVKLKSKIFIVELLSNSENREHLKIFRNVDCVLANHNKVQDMRANLKTTN